MRHIEGVLSYIDKMISGGYHETASRRLKVAGIETTPEEVELHLRIAGVFHDLGKAIEAYQVNYGDDCSLIERRTRGFYLHEVFSAVFLKRVFDGSEVKSNLPYLTVLAVLDHSHAMGRNFNVFKEAFSSDLTFLSREHRDIHNTIKKLIESGGYVDDKYITNLTSYVSEKTGLEAALVSKSL
ncbi:MAG: hypothetical protein ABDH63_03710, partial [Candidatus Caldarchaeales archaeon]